MRLNVLISAALAASIGTAAAAADPDAAFEANYQTARDNAGTTVGAAYDIVLGTALMTTGKPEPKLDACMAKHPGASGSLHGYVQFTTADRYDVVLRPQSPYATCIESALEGAAVPPPPSLPWFNVFVFNIG